MEYFDMNSQSSNSSRNRKVLSISLVGLLALIGWQLGRTQDALVLSNSCEIQGSINRLRERIQGRRFWLSQLAAVDNAIDAPQKLRKSRSQAESIGIALERAARQSMDSMILKYPQLKVPQKSEADILRERADSVEHETRMQLIDSLFTSRANSLLSCRANVAQKAGILF